MKTSVRMLLSSSLLTVCISATGQSIFNTPINFSLKKTCAATDSIRRPNIVKQVKPGEIYKAIGQNRPIDPTHILLNVNNKHRWVALDCGKPGGELPPPIPQPGDGNDSDSGDGCAVFFDNVDNPISTATGIADVTPPAPVLDEFDNAVLNLCAEPGKKTSKAEFIDLLRQNPAVLDKLMAFTNNKVRANGPALEKNAYLQELATVWYGRKAFDHVFCGENKGSKVGGLHFHGRYQQLQNKALLCRLDSSTAIAKNEIVPNLIYTIGIKMKFRDNKNIDDLTKGYGYTLSASDILLAGSRAFAENPTAGGNAACIVPLKDGNNRYSVLFVRTAIGIVTFYPDATPGGGRCSKDITLP